MNDIAERNTLITNHIPNCNKLIGIYCARYPEADKDEVRSIAYYAMVKSAARYNQERGIKYWTYAEHIIRNDIYSYIIKLR